MANGTKRTPYPENEPILMYAPGSPERAQLKDEIEVRMNTKADIPLVINGEHIRTGKTWEIHPPHEHAHSLGHFHMAEKKHVQAAIDAALAAREGWRTMPWEDRAAIFIKASELLAGPWRAAVNASTVLGQSKTCFQAEIDAACELIDFYRYNCSFMGQIYEEQPESAPGMWNSMEHRPLEGFVFAVSPFNFTSIGVNLAAAPAMMGNTVVWKPSETQVYSAWVTMRVLEEAGLPKGVINFLPGDGPMVGDICLKDPQLGGIHFTGSTRTFQHMWKTVGTNIENYRSYPRIVGETGGKDFIFAHSSADVPSLVTAITRGAFEYQGQKCSAASRCFIPTSLWDEVLAGVQDQHEQIKQGSPVDFSNFMAAVIDERAFDKIAGYIDHARKSKDHEIVAGGGCDKSKGWFIEPTVVIADSPDSKLMVEEIFGPVITLYRYEDAKLDETLKACDEASAYALTGAIFAKGRDAIHHMANALQDSAGNFYINDKPTGATVGQQPFGGGRASGTNDKAGSILNLLRWVSPRSIKETFVPPTDFRYPHMESE